MTPPTFRAGLLSARFTLFDAQMPPEFPAGLRARARTFGEWLASRFDLVDLPLIESAADATRAAALLAVERLDVLVVAPTMAVPPGWLLPAIAATDAPVLIWNGLQTSSLGAALNQAQATEHTTSVGCVMIANALRRAGRAATVVTTAFEHPETFNRLERTARALAAAGSLRGRTVLRVGDPIEGYTDVESSATDLARLGLREHAVDRAELRAAMHQAPDAESRDEVLASALDRLTRDTRALCGTINCHGDLIRSNPEVGIAACVGVARLTERGCPFACTGDLPTGIALYLMRAVSGAALYCEAYAPEPSTDLWLLLAGGEADPAWCADGEQVRIVPNEAYPGVNGLGASLSFPLRLGPATVMSLSPVGDTWILVWATGELAEARYHALRGPNGLFRFDSGNVLDAATRWIASGATHHNAVGPGRLDVEMPAIADALGIRSTRV